MAVLAGRTAEPRVVNLRLVRLIDRWVGVPLCHLGASAVRIAGRRAPAGDARRILVIRTWGLGNLTMMLPSLKALAERYPGARFDALTLRQNRGFLERTGQFTEIAYLSNESLVSFFHSLARALPRLRRARYDLLVDFEQFARVSSLIGLALGIPRRVGFDTPGQGRGGAYTDPVAYRNDLHMADCFFTLLAPLGIPVRTGIRPVPIAVSSEEAAEADRTLEALGVDAAARLAVVHPGSGPNFILRRWPAENFAGLADYLAERYGLTIVLTGVPDERDIVEGVRARMKRPAVDTVGRLTLGQLVALINRAALVVSNDTGPVHLASAQGTPVVAFYGPNTPKLYGPRGPYDTAFYLGLPCSPCITNYNEKVSTCTNPICLIQITLDVAIRQIEAAFPEGIPSRRDVEAAADRMHATDEPGRRLASRTGARLVALP